MAKQMHALVMLLSHAHSTLSCHMGGGVRCDEDRPMQKLTCDVRWITNFSKAICRMVFILLIFLIAYEFRARARFRKELCVFVRLNVFVCNSRNAIRFMIGDRRPWAVKWRQTLNTFDTSKAKTYYGNILETSVRRTIFVQTKNSIMICAFKMNMFAEPSLQDASTSKKNKINEVKNSDEMATNVIICRFPSFPIQLCDWRFVSAAFFCRLHRAQIIGSRIDEMCKKTFLSFMWFRLLI